MLLKVLFYYVRMHITVQENSHLTKITFFAKMNCVPVFSGWSY